jgi:3-mercaptopyruvate sulfurtransferase SseA
MTPDLAGLPKGYPFKTEYEFSPREFEALMKRGRVIDGDGKTSGTAGPKVMLVDVRTQPEWETARVAGSVFAPLDQLEQLASNLALEEADEIGVICHHGVRSM